MLLPILVLFLSELVAKTTSSSTSISSRIAVTLIESKLQNVPSCMSTYSKLILENVDKREVAIVYSIEAFSSSDNNHNHNDNNNDNRSDERSKEIRISFPDGHLTLNPKSKHVLSVLYSPSIPYQHHQHQQHVSHGLIKIHSSLGNITLPFDASASILNPYNIPHTIVFYTNGYVISSAGTTSADPSTPVIPEKAVLAIPRTSLYQYDLYMDNLNDRHQCTVLSITTTSERFKIDYSHHGKYQHDLSHNHNQETILGRFHNCISMDPHEQTYCDHPKAYESSGPVSLPPSSRRAYIATINLSFIDKHQTNIIHDYLYISTTCHFLKVALQTHHLPSQSTTTTTTTTTATNSLHSTNHQTNNHSNKHKNTNKEHHYSSSLNQKKEFRYNNITISPATLDLDIITSSKTTLHRYIHVTNHRQEPLRIIHASILIHTATERMYTATGASAQTSHHYESSTVDPSNVILTSSLPQTPSTRTTAKDFQNALPNTNNNRNKIKHHTNNNKYEQHIDDDKQQDNDINHDIALQIKVDLLKDNQNDDLILPPNAQTVIKAMIVTASSKTQLPPMHGYDGPRHYKGSLLIHVGPLPSLPRKDDPNDIRKPQQELQVTTGIVIPFSSTILLGDIKYPYHFVFFPSLPPTKQQLELGLPQLFSDGLTQTTKNDDDNIDTENPEYYITRTIPIGHDFGTTVRLVKLTIRGTKRTSSITCLQHFTMINFQRDENAHEEHSDYYHWGNVTLRYDFRTSNFQMDRKTQHHCQIILITDIAGRLFIPLTIYSGLFSIQQQQQHEYSDLLSSSCPTIPSTEHNNKDLDIIPKNMFWKGQSRYCLFQWYNSTDSGKSIHSWFQNFHLQQHTKDHQSNKNKNKNKNNNDASNKSVDATFFQHFLPYLYHLMGVHNSTTTIEETEINDDITSPFLIQPLVISFGDIAGNEVKSQILSISNDNPVPIVFAANTNVLEGMEISLNRIHCDILQFHSPSKKNEKEKNSKDDANTVDTMKRFLSSSMDAKHFFGKLRFRDDITLSPHCKTNKDLVTLFHETAMIQMHRYEYDTDYDTNISDNDNNDGNYYDDRKTTSLESRISKDFDAKNTSATSINQQQGILHPPAFENFHNHNKHFKLDKKSKIEDEIHNIGPVLLGLEGEFIHLLTTTKMSSSKKRTTWVIPPGGMAKFKLSVRSPDLSILFGLGKDTSSFLATGMVLHSNYGQIIPILVSYRALAGQLLLSKNETHLSSNFQIPKKFQNKNHTQQQKQKLRDKISVPARIMPENIQRPEKDNKNDGVPLKVKNAFSQPLRLLDIESCNKWFRIISSSSTSSTPKISADSPKLQNKNDDNSYTSIETLLNQKNNSDDNSTTTNDDGSVFVGTLYSQISCHTGSLTNFYSCAMEWLENRDTIQPIGCGMTDDDILEERMIVEGEDPSDANHAARESLRLQAIARFKKITTYFLQRYDNMPLMRRTNLPNNHQHSSYTSLRTQSASETDAASSSKTSGMFETDNDPFSSLSSSSVLIPTDLIDMFYTAVTAWDSLSLLGLNIISGNIQTKFKIGTQTENSTTLSSPIVSKEIASPLLHTELVIPRLFDPRFGDNSQVTSDGNILQFDMTVVAQVSKLFVPIRNPSGHAIRVRLTTHATNQPSPIPYPSDGSTTLRSVASEHSIFVQTKPSDKNPWWTGGSYFLTDSHGFLIQSIHNVTIQSSNGAYLSLINPSLYSSSLFLHGCVGRRCGLAVESHHRKDNDEKGDDKKFSRSMGASTSMKDRHIPSSSYTKNHELNLPAFALGLQSTDEIIIPPFGSREVGPVFFRPPGKGNFSCTLWLENSLTGLESITVRGTGGQEKVVFLDNDEESGTLSQKIETRFGQPSLLFSGSRGANGLPELRSVVVANVGDTAVTFDNVYMSSAEVMHFNQRKHKFRSTNIKHRIRNHRFKNCEERGFKLLNCFDENSHGNNNLNGGGLYGYFTSILWTLSHFPFYLSFDKNAVKSKFLGNKSEIINSNIRHGFSLEPNEKRTLYIAHTADCTYQKSFVTLNLEFKGRRNIKVEPMRRNNLNAWEKSFQDDKVELLVGYDMIDTDAKKCRPSTHVTGSVSSFTIEGKLNFDLPNEKLDEPFFYRKVLSPIFLIQLLGTIFFIRHLLELISTSKRRHKSLLLFQGYVTSGENPGDLILRSRIDTSENSSAYRCYSRDEITPSELVQAGKEQTRQSVLSKYKRLGILQPQCIMPNGTFRRERFSIGSAGGSKGESSISKDDRNTTSSSNRSRRVASLNCSSVTLYDSIFSEMRESKQQHSSVENKSILPCGLGWRKITTRGVLSSTLFDIDAITKKNCHKINELLRKRGMMNTISLNSLPAVFPLIDEKPSVRFAMSSIPSQKTNQKSSTLTKTSTPKESILRVKAAPKNETSKKVECLPKKEEKNTTLDEDHKKTDRKVKKEEMKMSSKELIHDNQISKSKVESRNDEKVENKTSNSVKKKVNRKKSVNDNMSDLLLSTDSKSSIEKNVRENRGEAATSLRKGNKASVEKNYFQTNRDQRGG